VIPFPIRKISPFGVDSGGQEWPNDTSAELPVSPEALLKSVDRSILNGKFKKFSAC
jgi:hypothetical protein